MFKNVKRVTIIFLLLILTISTLSYAEEWNIDNEPLFEDTYNHWGRRYVELLKATNIISGYPDGTFRPQNTIRVDEFLVLCIKSMGITVDTSNNDSGYWAKPFVNYGINNGLVDITYGQFDRPITRQEMALIAINTIEKSGTIENVDKDGLIAEIRDFYSIDSKFNDAVLKAYTVGLMSGNPDKGFYPSGTATRAEASVVVLRLVEEEERKPYVIEVVEVIPPTTNTTDIPEYLQRRFDTIADKWGLTWSDADFKEWHDSTPIEERDQYYNAIYAPPVFDFDKKVALISQAGQYENVQLQLKNLNDYNGTLPVDYFGYIAYEMYKRNIEMMLNDGEDFGRLNIRHQLDKHDVLYISVEDGLKWNTKSFDVNISSSDYKKGERFLYYMNDQYDKDYMEERLTWTSWEQFFQPHVENLTIMNYYFLHGKKEGQELYDNFVDAYEDWWYEMTSIPNTDLNITTDSYTVRHANEAGRWQLVYPKK